MAVAASYPYENPLSSISAKGAQSSEEKIDRLHTEVADKKAQIDYSFLQYASDVAERMKEKLDNGWFFWERTPDNLEYRAESKIRKRYWTSEWKKVKLDWKAERREAQLRGERITPIFGLKDEATSPRTGLTLSDLKKSWRERRNRDLGELQSDFENGRVITHRWPAEGLVAAPPASATGIRLPERPLPPDVKEPPRPVVIPQPRPVERKVEVHSEEPIRVERPTRVVEENPIRVSESLQPNVPAKSDEVQTVIADIQKSMAQLQESLDRALQLLNDQKSDIAEDRVQQINRRTELSKRDTVLKENTEHLKEERAELETEQRNFGQAALRRDQKKEALQKADAELTADRNAFEEQVELWERQQQEINRRLKEFHENAAEVSKLRADVESEKATIDKEEDRLAASLADVDQQRRTLDQERKDLKTRTGAVEDEISRLDTDTQRIMDARKEVAQSRIDLTARQKAFVDGSLKEWATISGEPIGMAPPLEKPAEKVIAKKEEAEQKTEQEKKEADLNAAEQEAEKEKEHQAHLGNENSMSTEIPSEHVTQSDNHKSPATEPGELELGKETSPTIIEEVEAEKHLTTGYPTGSPGSAKQTLDVHEPRGEVGEGPIKPAEKSKEEAAPPKETLKRLKDRVRTSVASVKKGLARKEEPSEEVEAETKFERPKHDEVNTDENAPLKVESHFGDERKMPQELPPVGEEMSKGIRDILYETKENLKGQASVPFEPVAHQTGGFGSAVKSEILEMRNRRNTLKAKKQEVMQELALQKSAAAQEIASLLKNRNQKGLLKTDDAVVAKLVERLADDRKGHEILQEYLREQKESSQGGGSKVILEGMRVTMQNTRISMSNAGGRMRHAARKAKGVGLTCTDGVGRLVSATARSRLAVQQTKPQDEKFEPR